MSKYTTELRYICENYSGLTSSEGYNDIDSIIEKARPKLFDFSYPIFDQAYKAPLENKIISHYYMREIGMETVGLFKHYLKNKMREIMPYYNELYKSSLLEFNPLYDVDLTTSHEGKGTKDRTENITTNETENNTTNNSSVVDTTENVNITNKDDYTETGSLNETNTVNENKITDYDETANSTVTKNETEKINETEKNTLTKTGNDSVNVTDNKNETTDTTNNRTTSSTGDSNKSTTYTGTRWDKFHDTPQGNIDLVNDTTYLTNARVITDSNTTTEQVNNSENGTINDVGKIELTVSDTREETKTINEKDTTDNTKTGNNTNDISENKEDTGTKDIKETTTSNNKKDSVSGKNATNEGNSNTDKTGKETGTGETIFKGDKDKTENAVEQINNTDEYIKHVYGLSGNKSFAELILQFRSALINIDMLIIDELNDLFMLLWDSGI